MIEIADLYFRWLMDRVDEDKSPAFERLCWMLDQNVFQRRVGNDENRASNGLRLRSSFLNDFEEAEIAPHVANDFLEGECTWLEMLIALAEALDFLYEGGVKERFLEMISNLGLLQILFTPSDAFKQEAYDEVDQDYIDAATNRVDYNRFSEKGDGGLFPLLGDDHPDQREVEIWDQAGAYFIENLEGVMWTSMK